MNVNELRAALPGVVRKKSTPAEIWRSRGRELAAASSSSRVGAGTENSAKLP